MQLLFIRESIIYFGKKAVSELQRTLQKVNLFRHFLRLAGKLFDFFVMRGMTKFKWPPTMTNYGIGYFATIFPGGSGAVNRRRRGNRPPRKWLNINAFGLERGTMPLLDPNQLNGILFVCWQPLISVAFLKVSSCANALGRTVKHSRGGHKRCSNRLSAENIYL